jgi:hypothetical protein
MKFKRHLIQHKESESHICFKKDTSTIYFKRYPVNITICFVEAEGSKPAFGE